MIGRGAPAERILAPEASGGLRLPPQPFLRGPGSAGEYRHQRRRQSLKEEVNHVSRGSTIAVEVVETHPERFLIPRRIAQESLNVVIVHLGRAVDRAPLARAPETREQRPAEPHPPLVELERSGIGSVDLVVLKLDLGLVSDLYFLEGAVGHVSKVVVRPDGSASRHMH